MKIVTLNTWGGKVKKPLEDFLSKYKEDVDIFCFQEVIHEGTKDNITPDFHDMNFSLYLDISKILADHKGYFRPPAKDRPFGLAMFIRKDIELEYEKDIVILETKGYVREGRPDVITLQLAELKNKKLLLANLHGLWNGMGKTDTEERVLQSENIINSFKDFDGEIILCGDFNLLPETESIKLFEKFGLRNLIKENKVESTRTSYYEKPLKYADYIFCTNGIKIKNFRVMDEEVSDHAALFLEFD